MTEAAIRQKQQGIDKVKQADRIAANRVRDPDKVLTVYRTAGYPYVSECKKLIAFNAKGDVIEEMKMKCKYLELRGWKFCQDNPDRIKLIFKLK